MISPRRGGVQTEILAALHLGGNRRLALCDDPFEDRSREMLSSVPVDIDAAVAADGGHGPSQKLRSK